VTGSAERPGRGNPRGSAQVVASGCLAAALLALTGVAAWSGFDTNAAAKVSQRDRVLADAYIEARFAVGAEESLERKYRLEPGPLVRAQHAAAASGVDQAMATIARYGSPHDRAVAAVIVADNVGYLAASRRLFAATDRGDVSGALATDHLEVDPVFGAMQSTVDAEADAHTAADAAAGRRLLQIEAMTRWATSLTVILAAGLIVLFSRLRRRFTRETDRQSRLTTYQATHDGLTGLPNRTLFAELLEQRLAASLGAGSVGVVLLDLDRFKEINDTLGHHSGDLLLQQIGPRIRGVLREGEVMARLGGDEFALLLSTDTVGAQALAHTTSVTRRILTALQAPFRIEQVSLTVEASAGIAMSPQHGGTGEVLLQRADIAMYTAKSQHVDIAVYDRALDGNNPRKLSLLGQLRSAIATSELIVHYQPLVDIASGEVRGAEALVRWQHPTEGMLPPLEFIPLAESSGLIHELTRYVLESACRQAGDWRDAGTPLVISVNVSARCLLDVTLPETVAEALARAGLPASLLKLELTESAIVSDPVRAQQVIARLHALGVSLSVDDFGSGYTSLAYLRDLPVQELKVDGAFVMRMRTDHRDSAIVRTVVELAARLGMQSVAEGIEDAETLIAVAAMGCTTAQGYHISRPMDAEKMLPWLAARKADCGSLPVG
jgi:diguanylate cyclase (GGDEF)-like protein